uniref:Uncharacterized protein n=1 Tax=viral metagenome TaxID=1070528 RepID=A0A6C0DB90_9ZZZZ
MSTLEIDNNNEQLTCLHISANLDFSEKPKMLLINSSQAKAEGNMLLGKFYVIHILEKDIILIGICKGKAIRRADFHIHVEVRDNVIKSLNKDSSYYIGYDFTSHHNSIEFEKWNQYERCNIYLYD